MRPDPITQFLSNWETLPSDGTECLSEAMLVALSKGQGSPESRAHVDSCPECREIFNLLQDSPTHVTRLMDEFIKRKADNAQAVSSRHSQSVFAYLKALLTTNQPSWGTATLAVSLAALLSMGAVSYFAEFRWRQKPVEVAYLDRDDYSYAAKSLQSAMQNLPTTISPQARPQQITAINKNIVEANESIKIVNRLYAQRKIQPDQRGQFNDLLLTYRTRLAFLRDSLDVTPVSKTSQQIDTTPDTDSVISVLSVINNLTSKKNDESALSSQTELQQAEIVRQTDLQVVRIDNDDSSKILSFRPRISEMSPEKRGELETTVNSNPFVSKKGLKFKILAGTSLTTTHEGRPLTGSN